MPAGNTNYANNIADWILRMSPTDGYSQNAAAIHGNTKNGVYAVPNAWIANNFVKIRGGHAGWNHVIRGTGPVASFAVTAAGSGFANGETVTVSNGTTNAVGTVVANSAGNATAVNVTSGGAGFTNTSVLAFAFNREKHMVNITVTTPGTTYSNTDTVQAGNGSVNAVGNVVTNGTGNLASIALTNLGLWANTKANTDVSFTILAANGSASAGSGGVLTANIGSSTGGTVTATLGGRAGRVLIETLDAFGSVAANAGGNEFDPLA